MLVVAITMFSVWDCKDQSYFFSGVPIHFQSSKKYRNLDCKKNKNKKKYSEGETLNYISNTYDIDNFYTTEGQNSRL